MDSDCVCKNKVSYKPVEAAVLWSNLGEEEAKIFHATKNQLWPDQYCLVQWPKVKFNLDRLYDGIINDELLACRDGIRTENLSSHDPKLTLRHVDLKAWMMQYYPAEKPTFLFDQSERYLLSYNRAGPPQVFLVEQDIFKAQIHQIEQILIRLDEKLPALQETQPLETRSERTYLSIIGAMLALMQKPVLPKMTKIFPTQESVIDAVLTLFPDYPGLSERTLRSKFAAARKHIGQLP